MQPTPTPTSIPRTHQRIALQITIDFESESNFYSGITGDISEGGVFVATFAMLPIGAIVEMTLCLPNQDLPMKARGVVRWLRELRAAREGMPPGFGVKWTEISAASLGAIARFAAQRDSIYFDAG